MKLKFIPQLILVVLISSCATVHKNGYHQSRKYKSKTIVFKKKNHIFKAPFEFSSKGKKNEKEEIILASTTNEFTSLISGNDGIEISTNIQKSEIEDIHTKKLVIFKEPLSHQLHDQTTQTEDNSKLLKNFSLNNKHTLKNFKIINTPKTLLDKNSNKTILVLALILIAAGLAVVAIDFVWWWWGPIAIIGIAPLVAGYLLLRIRHIQQNRTIDKSQTTQLVGETLIGIGILLILIDFAFFMYGNALIFGIPFLLAGLALKIFGKAKSSQPRRQSSSRKKLLKASAILLILAVFFFAISFALYFVGEITMIISVFCMIASLILLIMGLLK